MKKLLIALFIVGFIGACGSPTDPGKKEFEPYQVGSFMITSPESAEYVGTSSAKAKLPTISSGDTTYISQPDGNALTLTNDSTDAVKFNMVYIDSSVTLEDFRGKSIDVSFSNQESFSVSGHGVNILDRMEVDMSVYYNGAKTGVDSGNVFISIFNEDGSNYKTFAIETNKMTDTVEEIIQ